MMLTEINEEIMDKECMEVLRTADRRKEKNPSFSGYFALEMMERRLPDAYKYRGVRVDWKRLPTKSFFTDFTF